MESKMNKIIDAMANDFASMRAGRANPSVLDKIVVDYYGTPTPLTQLANVSAPEPRMLVVQPYDAGVLKEMEKAIIAADIGLAPNNDGKVLRLNFPPLTEDRRKELVKSLKARAEEAKVSIRNVRRDGMDGFKAELKNKEITEDDLKVMEKDLQNLTDKMIKEVDDLSAKKEKEIMEV
jgi:ribosome recycling factor